MTKGVTVRQKQLYLALGLVLTVQQPIIVDVLDLTLMREDTSTGRTSGSAGDVMTFSDWTPPIKLSLTIVGPQEYSVLDEFLFEVILTNTGTQPISIPWSAEPSLVEQKDATNLRGFLRLALAAFSARPAAHSVTLYGSSAVAGSTKMLQPNDSVLIRGNGVWRIHEDLRKLLLSTVPSLVPIRAEYSLQVNRGPLSRQVISPTVEVYLKRRY